MAESAFRLFDRDRSGTVDFREFCCGISIICLASTNEKIRFIFDLFDLDRDGYLNRQELRLLLETAVLSYRRVQKGEVDKQWPEHHLKAMGAADFQTFRAWAERNLNVYHILSTFMLVPSPAKERKEVTEVLARYERRHGDTMYAVSYRWWERWKEYTEQHQSTIDQLTYAESLKQSLADSEDNPEFVRNFLQPYYEEQKETDLNDVVLAGQENFNNQSLKREYSRAHLTPRSDEGEPSHVLEDSQRIVINKKGLTQLDVFMKMKDNQQLYFSKRSG